MGRGIGRLWLRSVFLLQARERPELAPSASSKTEDVNHSRGAQTTFDRALDVGSSNDEARAHARAAVGLALARQHKRAPDF
jgi:hypothetical protein